ncbi:MAG: ester cyclase [Nitrospiria bacterium]
MKSHRERVRKFYDVIWNAHDLGALPSLLHPDFGFRGSLGEVINGHADFADYVDRLHSVLGDYRCRIDALVVSEGEPVFAKMCFSGVHRTNFMGYVPTGKKPSWTGCALFTFKGLRIVDVWVLGDLKDLEAQLEGNKI